MKYTNKKIALQIEIRISTAVSTDICVLVA